MVVTQAERLTHGTACAMTLTSVIIPRWISWNQHLVCPSPFVLKVSSFTEHTSNQFPFFFSYLIANVRLLTSPLAAKFTTPMAYTLAALRLRRLANTFQQIKNATAKIDISAVCGEVLGFSCPSPWLWRA